MVGHGADSFREFSRQLINLSPAQVFSLGTKDSTSSTSQQVNNKTYIII